MRLWLSEADKSRFINPVWDVIEKDPEDVLVVSNVPKSNRIYCLNVPPKCKVTYKTHPETALEVLYTDCAPSNLSEKRYRFIRAF